MTAVRHPYLRSEIVDAVRSLADREHQQRVWLDRNYPTPSYDEDFDAVVHWLFDDTDVLTDPASLVGSIVRTAAEADVMAPLRAALDTLLDTLGAELSDEEYVSSPLWDPVVEAAVAALAVLEAPG